MHLADLIERVERAAGPDFALGVEVLTALGRSISDPNPTMHSIDAALRLVPEGWFWSLDFTQRAPYRDCGRAYLFAPGAGVAPQDVQDIYAATPALAITAAALRARMQGET